MSFCPGKDLLSLSETSTTFNRILSDSKKLTRKLVFCIKRTNFDKNPDEDVILHSRKYTSLAMKDFTSYLYQDSEFYIHPWNKNQVTMLFAVADTFTEIEHVKMKCCFFTQSEFENLMKIFVSRLKSLTLHAIYAHQRYVGTLETDLDDDTDSKWVDRTLFAFDSLEELCITKVPLDILKSFMMCTKIKKFEIVTCVAHTDLERIQFEDYDEYMEGVGQFLRNQKNLKILELDDMIGLFDFIHDILPSLDKLVYHYLNQDEGLNFVPHHHLKKVWLKFHGCQAFFRYTPEVVEDSEQIELNILECLSNNAGEDIKDVIIGTGSWMWGPNVVALSEKFVETLIQLLPQLERLSIFCATDLQQILRTVSSRGRNFKRLYSSTSTSSFSITLKEQLYPF
jgi:hypothetical protein